MFVAWVFELVWESFKKVQKINGQGFWKNKDTYIALPLYFFKTVFYLLISLCLKKHIALFYWFSLYSNSVFIIVLLKFTWIDHSITQRARKFKKVQAKKLVKSNIVKKNFSSNCIFGSFKLFPSSKIDFWPFLKSQKMKFCPNFFFVKLIYFWFHEFFWPGLF